MTSLNDPHVEALYYKIKHGDHVDYSKTAPLELTRDGFRLKLQDGRAEILLGVHIPSVETARAFVEPFLQAWELHMNLAYGPGALEFVYERPVLIDRQPSPKTTVFSVQAANVVVTGCVVRLCVGFANFPTPKTELARDAAVDLMYARYVAYREGRTLLGDAANYCLTAIMLGAHTTRRQDAAKHYRVADKILGKVGYLADHKGGAHARKAKGSGEEFTGKERLWLEEAMRVLIRRAAEVAHDPHASLPQITMAELPSLSD